MSEARDRDRSRSGSPARDGDRDRSKSPGAPASSGPSGGKREDRDRGKSASRSRSRSPSRSRSRTRSRSRSRKRRHSRSRSRGRGRRSSRSRSRSRGRGRRRSRSRSRSGSRSRSRGRGRGRRPAYADQDPTVGRKVYIGDLSYETREEDLRRLGTEYGEVVDVFMPRNRDGGPRGFGFVTFTKADAAEEAADRIDGSDIQGRRVKANIARARPPRPDTFTRTRYGGGRRNEKSPKIYVGNLPMDTNEGDLHKFFDRYGNIRHLELKRVQKPPMFGFVEYEDERDAEDAVEGANQKEFRGAYLRVEFANSSR